MNVHKNFPFFPCSILAGGVSAYTSQAIGGVMATGSVSTQQISYGGQPIGNDRYILTNPSSQAQYDRVYVSGLSG